MDADLGRVKPPPKVFWDVAAARAEVVAVAAEHSKHGVTRTQVTAIVLLAQQANAPLQAEV